MPNRTVTVPASNALVGTTDAQTLTNKTIAAGSNTISGISEAMLATTDVTTGNVSASKHGFAPKAPNDATKFLDGTGAWGTPAGGAVASKLNGVAVVAASAAVDIQGSGKALVDLGSNIAALYLPNLLDFREYVRAAGGSKGTGKSQAVRQANATALQNALTDCYNQTYASRQIYVPGGPGDVWEFDLGAATNNTITFNSGVSITSLRPGQDGPQFHLYGTASHHFFTGTPGMSRCLFEGIQFRDMRTAPADRAAADLHGDCFTLSNAHDGLQWRDCFFLGFRRQVFCDISDVIRVERCWLGGPYESGVYLTGCLNTIVIQRCDYDLGSLTTHQFYVSGGGVDSVLAIEDLKGEGGAATGNVVTLNAGVPATKLKNISFRGGVAVESVVRFQGVGGDGIGESVVMENIAVTGGRATNLLKIVSNDGSPETYAILAHASQACAIHSWDRQRRVLSKNIETTNAFTQAASGTAAGTVVPSTGAGTSPTIAITGTDESGVIALTTGTTPAASAQVFAMNFRAAWPRTPKSVTLTPADANAAALSGTALVFPGSAAASRLSRTFARFYVGSTALAAATLYTWHYKVNP